MNSCSEKEKKEKKMESIDWKEEERVCERMQRNWEWKGRKEKKRIVGLEEKRWWNKK